jgi:hypothetical protein
VHSQASESFPFECDARESFEEPTARVDGPRRAEPSDEFVGYGSNDFAPRIDELTIITQTMVEVDLERGIELRVFGPVLAASRLTPDEGAPHRGLGDEDSGS